MPESNYWQQIRSYLDLLPCSQDVFFREVWQKGRLRFEGAESQVDWVDKCCAQLACATLSQRNSLLIVLPDESPHRVPLLFATLLLMQAYNAIHSKNTSKQNTLYFGTTAGIRAYLSKTYCSSLRLSEVFEQTNLSRDSIYGRGTSQLGNSLPHVIFSYAPIALEKMLAHYRPSWCFIDGGIGERLQWLPSILTAIKQTDTPIIACIQAPFSEVIQRFQKACLPVFRFPYTRFKSLSRLEFDGTTTVRPVVIEGETVFGYSEQYKEVYGFLFSASGKVNGKLAQDALRAIWRYIRALEQLNTPYDFYESESRQFWGLHSLSDYQQTVHRFVETLQSSHPSLSEYLGVACEHLDKIHQQLQSVEPPLWNVLCNLCVDNVSDDAAHIFVFPSEARKDLFALAFLAYYDISTNELSDIGVWLVSLRQFNQLQRARERRQRRGEYNDGEIPSELAGKSWYPLLLGLPYRITKYAPLARCDKLDILIYPHQIASLRRHIDEWNQELNVKHPDNLKALATLSNNQLTPLASGNTTRSQRLLIVDSLQWQVGTSDETVHKRAQELFYATPRVDEIALLMQEDDDELADDSVVLDEQDKQVTGEGVNKEPITVEQAIRMTFCEGYHVLLPTNATMQVVLQTSQGRKLDERSVRSLRTGDVVMFIHGQRRQNLYELILSRVHAHPSFALYLNLIQRWQDELVQSYKKSRLTVEEILYQMRQRGSQLQTQQAIRLWFCRYVMCPNDEKDLQRIADVLDMSFVKQYHRQIARAASRLRGIHRGLSRKLNHWLQYDAVETTSGTLSEIIDAELGLTFQDFQDALLLLTVATIEQADGLFLSSELGKLYRKGDVV